VAGTWACEYDSALRSKGVDYKIDYIAVGRAWRLLDDPWLLAVDIRHFVTIQDELAGAARLVA
jgi:hypothetical protein